MPISTLNSVLNNKGLGKGITIPVISANSSTSTNANANSGFTPFTISFNNIGTTLPSTRASFPLPPNLPSDLFVNLFQANHQNITFRTTYLAWFYLIGTVDLANAAAVPYDGFTHDAAWSGTLRRTVLGVADTPITMFPVMQITTATATTAPAFILKTTAGAAGYVNQDNSNVIGTKTFTCPAAATAIGSTYLLKLEADDSGIEDLTQISVTTKGTTGAATIWGVELLAPAQMASGYNAVSDTLVGGIRMNSLKPAVASTGTVTSRLGVINFGGGAQTTVTGSIHAVLNA